MPRIRTIKPEFFSSPSTAKASPWARLAFIGMWCWADDHGRGTLNYKELEGFIFPFDDSFPDCRGNTDGCRGNTANFRDVVAEVSECFGVTIYEVDGRLFYAISSWNQHQRNEKRSQQSRYPEPPAKPDVTREDACVADLPRISATQEREYRESPSLEQGIIGTGDHRNIHSCASDDSERESAGSATSNRESVKSIDQDFEDWYKRYPRKRGKGQAMKAYRSARKKTTHEALVVALENQRDILLERGPDYVPYPATWLNGERWLDEIKTPPSGRGSGPESITLPPQEFFDQLYAQETD